MRNLKNYIPFILLLVLVSCVGPAALQRSINKKSYQLGYAFDSKIDTLKSENRIYFKGFDKLQLNDTTKVKKYRGYFWFILVAGGYNYDFTVMLGKNSVIPSIPIFVNNSIQFESKRSGRFYVANNIDESDYVLELNIVDCNIEAKYHKDGLGIGQSTERHWAVKPATGSIRVEAVFFKNDSLIFKKEYSSSKSTFYVDSKSKSENELNKNMMENFAETVSINVKEINEAIIKDINAQLNH